MSQSTFLPTEADGPAHIATGRARPSEPQHEREGGLSYINNLLIPGDIVCYCVNSRVFRIALSHFSVLY